MQNKNKPLILTKDDYNLLNAYLAGGNSTMSFDRNNAEKLQAELNKAKVVSKDDFPPDVVRLNSIVSVKAEDKNEIMEFVLVTPDKADVKAKKISVMAPLGTALIGFRKGQKVIWQVPAGKRTFTILDVINAH